MKGFSKWFCVVLQTMMGWLFFWLFLDKLYEPSIVTAPGQGWIDASSPYIGFLKFGTKGPFEEFFTLWLEFFTLLLEIFF